MRKAQNAQKYRLSGLTRALKEEKENQKENLDSNLSPMCLEINLKITKLLKNIETRINNPYYFKNLIFEEAEKIYNLYRRIKILLDKNSAEPPESFSILTQKLFNLYNSKTEGLKPDELSKLLEAYKECIRELDSQIQIDEEDSWGMQKRIISISPELITKANQLINQFENFKERFFNESNPNCLLKSIERYINKMIRDLAGKISVLNSIVNYVKIIDTMGGSGVCKLFSFREVYAKKMKNNDQGSHIKNLSIY